MWGGATFDVALRFLHEDPWERLAAAARGDSRTSASRCCCARRTPSAIRRIRTTSSTSSFSEAAAQGIDIFRIFDSLNWLPNMQVAMEAVRKTQGVCEAAICYTGDILDPKRDKYSLQYYVRMAKELERMGAHVLAIKDMAGLCKPYAADELVKALARRDRHSDPLPHARYQRHQCGVHSEGRRRRRGRRGWRDRVDERHHQPAEPELDRRGAAHTERDTGLDLDALNQLRRLLGNRSHLLRAVR